MKNGLRTPTALRRQIADLEAEVEALTEKRDRLLRAVANVEQSSLNWAPAGSSVGADRCAYVLADDDAEARAFDDFYRAYDDGHAKTRKFLLG